MPKVSPDVLQGIFYLFATEEDAASNVGYGSTGFFAGVSLPSDKNFFALYAVSNWHVAVQGYPIIRVNHANGGNELIHSDCGEWIYDPKGDDIAILPVTLAVGPDKMPFKFMQTDLLMTDEFLSQTEIGAGEDVFMVGRFVDTDCTINRPAMRFGNISIMPIPVHNEGTDRTNPTYVLDMHSRDGFSGSPVFVYRTLGSDLTGEFSRRVATGELPLSMFTRCLGIHWGQFPEIMELSPGETPVGAANASVKAPAQFVKGLSGMTCVAPAQAILKLLRHPKLVAHLREMDSRCRAAKEAGAI